MNRISSLVVLFIITACGGGGGGGGGEAPTPPTPAPGISFSATPTSVLLNNTSTFSWSTTNATSCTASGSNNWTGTKATSGTEDVSIDIAGNTVFTLSCSGAGGTRNASVTVEGYRQTDGVVVDGYISGADVFIDENANFIADASENATTSDNDGKFTIKYANGNLVSIGGTDLDSQTLLDNLLITHKLDGYSDFKAITPVTSVDAFLEAVDINAALGIDSSINVAVDDPVALKGDGGIYDYLYEKGNQLTVLAYALQNITNDLNTTTETTQDFFKSIAEEVETEYVQTQNKVDIETTDFISRVLSNVETAKALSLNETDKSNTVTALASVIPIIQVKDDANTTTSLIRFGVSQLQEDIVSLANGSASDELVEDYTEDVINYIATTESISSDNLTPDISSIDDSASVDEDAAVDIFILNNDSFVAGAPFDISTTLPMNGDVEIINNYITYTPDADYFGDDDFSYTLSQGNKTASADVSVEINSINDAPSIDIASTLTVAENQTAITTISISDVDEDDLTLTLGGTDADSLNLSTENVLSFKEAPDYETKNNYEINLSLTDGTETVDKDISILITDLNDVSPIFTSSPSFSAPENQLAIGTVTASDEEDDELSFSISGEELAITEEGVLTFISAPDFETKSSYSAVVTVSDGINEATQDIAVNVTNVNDVAPVFTSSATFSAAENQTAIGTVTATDAEGDDVTFTITGNELAITSTGVLTFISAPDFETKNKYIETVTVSDGVNTSSQSITVNVLDVDEIPPVISINGDNPVTIELGSTYTDAGAVADGGETVSLESNIDTAKVGSYTVTYFATDAAGNTGTATRVVNVVDTTAPTVTVIGDNPATSELGLTYTDAGATASDLSGEVSVATSGTVDINTIGSYTLTYSATDASGNTGTATRVVVVQDTTGPQITILGDNPETVELVQYDPPDSVYKDTAGAISDGSEEIITDDTGVDNTSIGTYFVYYSATDSSGNKSTVARTVYVVDTTAPSVRLFSNGSTSDVVTVELGSTFVDSGAYATDISMSTGQGSDLAIPVTVSGSVDTSIVGTYTLTYTATDASGNVGVATKTVNVVDTTAPVFTSSATFSAVENQTAIGTVTATDLSGNILFSIASDEIEITTDGVLSFVTAPDYETKSSYTATVTVSDGTNTATQDITVAITNINDIAPAFTSSETFSAAENQTAIGTVTATDADGDDIVFTVSGNELSITSTGVLTFSLAPDYETKSIYVATITANDGSNSTTQEVTVNVINVNDNSPVYSSAPSFFADENQTAIGSVTATDADGDGIVYSISGTEITIDASSGLMTFVSAPDYENKSLYSATVIASDGRFQTTQNITVTIDNVNDITPSIISTPDFTIPENESVIGTVEATDPEGDTLSFYITSDEIAIDINSGELSFISPPDFETKNFYTATVRVSDGLYSTNQNITVSITDINDVAPVITSDVFNVLERDALIGTVKATDQDSNNLTFSIDSSEISIDESSGVMTFLVTTDAKALNLYNPVVTVSDGELSTSKTLTINVRRFGESAPDLFISEYGEGSSQNKYLEITNYTGSSVSLDDYAIPIVNNSPTILGEYEYWNGDVFGVGDTILNGGTYVICHPDADQVILDACDATYRFLSNGDDGLKLVKGTEDNYSVIDVLGDYQGDPGSGWDVCGVESATHDHTLVKKDNYAGSDDWDVSRGTNANDCHWIVKDKDDWSNLGDHIYSNFIPVITSTNSFTVEENKLFIGYVSATDENQADTLSYSISGDNLTLNSEGVLSFIEAADYESKNTYEGTVTVSDGINQITQDITINVTNLNDNAPEIRSEATFSAAENQTAIGTVTATDADGDGIIFSITGTEIAIDSSSGKMSFISTPDYETKSTYTATIAASDGVYSTTQDITVNISNVNDIAPVFTSDSIFTVEENQTTIGTVTATDAEGDDITFSISESELAITSSGVLTFASAPDYETKSTYTAIVSASDGANTTNQNITVNITNLNESPVLSSNAISINEGITEIASNVLNVSDPESDEFSVSIKPNYSFIVGGSANGSTNPGYANDYNDITNYKTFGSSDGSTFIVTSDTTLSGNYKITSNIQLADGVTLTLSFGIFWGDEDGLGSNWRDYTRIEVLNGSLVTTWAKMRNLNIGYFNLTKQGSIQLSRSSCINCLMGVQDGNTNAGSLLINRSYLENVSNGSWMSFNYPPATFNIQNSILYNSGQISVSASSSRSNPLIIHDNIFAHADDSTLDFPGGLNKYPGKDNDDRAYINYFASNNIRLSSQNNRYLNSEIPVFYGNDDIYSENDYFGSSGLLENRHYNSSDNITYQDVNISNPVAAHTSETQIKLQPRLKYINDQFVLDFPPDYEARQTSLSYIIDITDNDGVVTSNELTISILNTNEAPFITTNSSFNVQENILSISDLNAIDPEGDDITFSVSGSELEISAEGVLTFTEAPDYESKTTYSATVSASDGVNSTNQDITINILDVDEVESNDPELSNITFSTNNVDVTDESKDVTVTLNAKDVSGISLATSGDPSPRFVLGTTRYSGTWSLISGNIYDGTYQTTITIPNTAVPSSYLFYTGRFNDKWGNTADVNVSDALEVVNSNAEAEDPELSNITFSTNNVDVTDESKDVTVTLNAKDVSGISLATSGDPSPRFVLGTTRYSGTWSLISGNIYDGTYQTTITIPNTAVPSSYLFYTGRFNDKWGNTADVNVSDALVVYANINSPSFTSSDTFSAAENQTAIGTVTATDADGDSITYSISGSDITINSSSGVIAFASAPDYETKSTYTATVTASDGSKSATQDITVNVTDVNEAPAFTSSTTFSAAENQTAIGTVTATDPESDTLTFSISSDDININSASGVITFVSAPDYESQSSYTATVSVTDDVNSAVTQNITVNVTNVAEAVAVDDSSSGIEDDNIRVDVLANDTFISSDVTITATDGTNMSVEVQNDSTSVAEYGHPTIIYSPDANWFGTDTFTYTVSSGGESDQGTVSVTVRSVNDAPTITSEATFSAAENQTDIGTVTATDIEDDTLTYSISGSDISIDSSTGAMTFNSAPDYETTTSYSATVTVSDGTDSDTQDITVNITNANDNSPAFTSNATFSAEENQTAIGTVVASDADGDGIAYSISGSDITINASSGVIAFVSAPDYETATSYSATVTASDGLNSVTQDITVNIQNIPDVSGIAYVSRYSVMDNDIPNTEYLAYSDNDYIDTAQSLTNPSIVTGHVGGDDTWDVFSVSTTSSMYVNLDVIDYIDDTKELRVLIYNSDGSSRETSYTSASIEQNMTVLLPDSGDYLIVVDDLYGSSNYILTLGQRYSASTYEASTDFIPDYISNELIGYTPQNNIGQGAQDNISDDKSRQIEAEKLDLFNLTGETFDRPGVKKFNMRSINGLQPSPSDDINNTNRFGNGSFGIAPLTQRQKDYYNDWSYLQKLRKISSETIFDFNYEFETTAFSRDPQYSKQWNLERVQLEPALNSLGQDVKNVAVAVIDSGGPTPGSTAWNESNLIDGGYDFIYGNSNSIDYYATSSYSGNKSSHGTHVSTTIAAKNNNVGINGYAVKALNINVFNNPTDETSTTTSLPIIDAILYASGLGNSSNSVAPSDTPIKVINLSLKASGNILYTLALCSAVVDAYNQGISIVAAAGNDQDTDPGSISYPASCAGAISVGATNSAGNISHYSQQNEYVDISAPGGGSSDLDGDGSPDWILAYGNDSQLKPLQGTSMASPQVAAAIALMYSVDSTLTPARVDNMLANGELTDDRGISGKDNAYGYGELNLAKATRNIQEDVGISVSFGYTSTSFLEFGADTTELTIDLIKIGETPLSFSSLTSSNATGLSYNATSTDAEGFGTYTLFIDRNSIPNGEYSTVVNFNLSDGSKIAVRIYYNVGSLRSPPNIGKVFIGMYDASDDSLWGYGELEIDGSVSFTASDVSPGNYYIVTSTDINDNNTICEYGELCEYYPRLSDISNYFTVSDSNLSGYEIYLNPLYKYGGPNAASLSSNSQLSNINNNIAKQKNISGSGKILIDSISPAIPDNLSKKGKNPVIPE